MAYSDGTLFYKKAPISPQTAAVTAKAPVDARAYSAVTLSADNLAGAEEVDIFIWVNGGWETYTASDGAAIKLTATIPLRRLDGGARYGVVKDTTAGACGVFAEYQRA